MSFAREQKRLNEQTVFNPPPGYYQAEVKANRPAPSFAKAGRFAETKGGAPPGPGAYNDDHKELVRKRLIEESQKREVRAADNNGTSNIKISSIPSIPKKSATRVYEQLAPGILILHEQEYENTSIGPGSYNITDKCVRPKPVAHKIAPEHRSRPKEDEGVEVNVPTIAEQIRNERRLMYKQNLIKSSTVNKSEISPSDLCLEVIILREKLLRSDQNPPPGYYHTQNGSDFKAPDALRPPQNQHLGGREKRFMDLIGKLPAEVGPGSYALSDQATKKGGFLAKSPRKLHDDGEEKPGPGAYISQKAQAKADSKASYPPIFGSGCARFSSAPKTLDPGPGAYRVEKKRTKKQKYIKIKRELLEATRSEVAKEPMLGIQSETSQLVQAESVQQRRFYPIDRNTSNFASKVQRFEQGKSIIEGVGPGNYEPKLDFASRTHNRRKEGYLGSRQPRFDQNEIRPKIGPGTYDPAYDTVKEKKIANIFL